VEIIGGSRPVVAPPEAQGLTFVKGFQSQGLSWVNGEVRHRRSFQARATKEGIITVPPFTVTAGNSTLKSKSLKLTASKGRLTPRRGSQSRRGDIQQEELLFTKIYVDKDTVYLGEAITLTLEIWTIDYPFVGLNRYRNPATTFPDTTGFYALPQAPKRVGEDSDSHNDMRYGIMRYVQVLYPTSTGDLTIGSWELTAHLDVRSDTVRTHNNTEPITVSVKALPPSPPDFTGTVGAFEVTASVSEEEVMPGIPVDLDVTVSGHGNPDAIGAPTLPSIENAYVRDPEINIEFPDGPDDPMVRKRFRYTITPTDAGELLVPDFTYAYFDPYEGEFKAEAVGPYTVNVLPSADRNTGLIAATSSELAGTNTAVIGLDTLKLITNVPQLRQHNDSRLLGYSFAIAPVLVYGAVALVMARKRRFTTDTGYARSYFASGKARKRMQHIAHAEEPADELYRTVVGFLADKFNVPEASVTSSDAQRLLDERGVDVELSTGLLKILRACERARYGSEGLSPQEIHALANGANAYLNRLDVALKENGS
jgi:hypothetical protein